MPPSNARSSRAAKCLAVPSIQLSHTLPCYNQSHRVFTVHYCLGGGNKVGTSVRALGFPAMLRTLLTKLFPKNKDCNKHAKLSFRANRVQLNSDKVFSITR